jgi:predicted ester cyclase
MKRLEVQTLRGVGIHVEDVARHTGVSPRTVQRVANEGPIVDPVAVDDAASKRMGRPSKVATHESEIETQSPRSRDRTARASRLHRRESLGWRGSSSSPPCSSTLEALIAEGDEVAVRYTERGTFRRPAFGREPTGKSYELVAMEWFTISGGKIVRRWGARDAASQARQLGISEG